MAGSGDEEVIPGKAFFGWLEQSAAARGFLYAAMTVLGMWLAVWIVVPRFYTGPEAGVFGDSFGVVTSLFSGLTLLGAGYAVYLQHEELKIARDQNRGAEQERAETLRVLARQADALTTAAKLQAISAIGQMDVARFQYHQIDLAMMNPLVLKPILERVDSSRQFAQILLLDAETPNFDWGGVAIERRAPIRKFYLQLLRGAIAKVRAFPEDASVFDPIKPLMDLQREVEILAGQVDAGSIGGLLLMTHGELEGMIVWLRSEGGIPPMEERARLTREDYELRGAQPIVPDHFDAGRKSAVLDCLRGLENQAL